MAISHYEMKGSPHFELVRSGHYEFNPGGSPGMALLHASVFAPGWAPFTFPGPGWPWGGGVPVGVLSYTTISYSASREGGGTLNAVMNLSRYNQIPTSDGWTSLAPFSNPSDDVLVCNILWGLLSNGLGGGTYTTTATSATYSQTGLGSASISLSAPFTLEDLRNNAHFLLGQINIQAVPTGQRWDIEFAPGQTTAFPQEIHTELFVPTLYQTSSNVYYWGWGIPFNNPGIPPQDIPMPYKPVAPLPPLVTVNPTPVEVLFRSIKAQSSYTGGNWDMWKSIWRKPGQSSVGLQQEFTATVPGPPTQVTPTSLVLPCDPNGDFILTPSGTPIDIIADTGNNNYMGVRFPNFTP